MKTNRPILIVLCLSCLGVLLTTVVADEKVEHFSHSDRGYEQEILNILDVVQTGKLDQALALTASHLQTFPKSKVGHFLRADILSAMSSPLQDMGENSMLDSKALQGLRHQLRNRWEHDNDSFDKAHMRYPANLLEIGQHPYLLVADLQGGRLYLYRNNDGKPELLKDYYMSVGSSGYGKQVEGDNKTPIGVYQVTKHIDGKELPDLYGSGAFPIDYPNRIDRYRGRTGYGIWLHGTPSDTYARQPWASEGCFVLSNDDLIDIGQYLSAENRTPVILSEQVEWLTADQLARRKSAYNSIIQDWLNDWQSLDIEAYLTHYSKEQFNLGRGDFNSWAERKRQVNKEQAFIQVEVDIESLFIYPGESEMFVVNYNQSYVSNNYSDQVTKQQYWQRDAAGRWKIIYED